MRTNRPTNFTSSFRNFLLTTTFAAALSSVLGVSPTPSARNSDQVPNELRRLCEIGPQNSRLSAAERTEVKDIKEHLRNGDPQQVVSGFAEGIHNGKPNREVPAYRKILPELPAVKQEMLRRIAAESNPVVKGGLINCMSYVKGADVIRALMQELDDKRGAAVKGGPSQLRVCDEAFNVIYDRIAAVRELGFDFSSDMTDAIHPDVPVEGRDARIAKLKAALVAKYGPDLKLPDGL